MPAIRPGIGIGVPAGTPYDRVPGDGRVGGQPSPAIPGGLAPRPSALQLTGAQASSQRPRVSLPDSQPRPQEAAPTSSADENDAMAKMMSQYLQQVMMQSLQQMEEHTKSIVDPEPDEDEEPDDD